MSGVDASTTPTTDVTVIVEPNGKSGRELTDAIAAAKTSVYMTMYQIDDDDVINALVAQAKAGLDVQAILDSSSTSMGWNTDAYNKLRTAGVNVVWSSSVFSFTHEKCVVIDGTSAWIMTMNANSSSPDENREYLALDTDTDDIAEATAVFKADHAMSPLSPAGPLVVADSNARPKLVALIATATHDLDLEGEEVSDTNSGGVVQALGVAAHRGVAVRVVIGNSGGSTSQTQAITTLKQAGVKVVITGPESGDGTKTNPYIHAKALVVDCQTGSGSCASGFVGSENFSAGSLGYNRELGVIFTTASELAKVESAIDTDFANGTAQ
jgi:phosphatidylserine/phosphatidylglycerophosphate/cardiolipin synthase-like enzyme